MEALFVADYLNEVTALTQHHETMRQVLGGAYMSKREEEESDHQGGGVEKVPSALSKLTGPTYSFSDIIRAGRSTGSGGSSVLGKSLFFSFCCCCCFLMM